MTRDQLTDALDRYGADLDRWPAVLRAAAETLVTADPAAAATLARAGRLDAGLAALAAPAPLAPGAVTRIVAHATADDAPRPLHVNRLVAGLSAAAVLAFFIAGFAAGLIIRDDGADEALAALLFGASPVGMEKLL